MVSKRKRTLGPIIECPGCYEHKHHSAHGYCHSCYKREVWRRSSSDAVQREYDRTTERRKEREGHTYHRRPRKYAKCLVCGRFKSRPSSVCDYCGDDPVTYNGDPRQYDLAMGWEV